MTKETKKDLRERVEATLNLVRPNLQADGGDVELVDVEEDTFNLDCDLLEQVVTDRTRAIVPVHLFGQCADMDRIMDFANNLGIYVIEDNAQSIGADHTGSNGTTLKAGTIGHMGTTSFFPSKNLGAFGDGGALFTRDESFGNLLLGGLVNGGSLFVSEIKILDEGIQMLADNLSAFDQSQLRRNRAVGPDF